MKTNARIVNNGKTKETPVQFISKQDVPKGFSGWCYVLETNDLFHYSFGMLHSVNDEPAHINESEQRWYKLGVHHRENGPATIGTFYKAWYYNGVPHRLNGPALHSDVLNSLEATYAIHGTYIKEKDYYNHPKVIKYLMNQIIDF